MARQRKERDDEGKMEWEEVNLQKLKRSDLLELYLNERKENELLREELSCIRKKLEDQEILCEESGSIAEAALKINRVFEAAQAAADLYVANIKMQNMRGREQNKDEKK